MSRKRATARPPATTHSAPEDAPGKQNGLAALVCALLVVIVGVVFSQTLRHGFVNYDDNTYVYDNPEVSGGLTMKGIAWAFTHVHSSNWHPLTWISHMLDCQLYGLSPGGHHLTSILLHAAAAVLLFLALREMTGALWRSAFVAAVFAIHPLRVESAAWVAERKDVLSGLFFILTLWAYVRYARGGRSLGRYAMVMLWFALGLMSKPMLVTAPFVLLLLDYWPLCRVPNGELLNAKWKMLIVEKLPLFLLSAASCVVTVLAQRDAMAPVENLPLFWRLANSPMAYVTYLKQTVWPSGLAAMYPHPGDSLTISALALSLLFLIGTSAAVFVLRRKCPYALTGWLWFLGMLVPVIGVLQVGNQAYADRYTYLPQIGLLILVTWGVADLTAAWRHRRTVCGAAAALILAALMVCAWIQTSYWRDSLTLWDRMLKTTSGNDVAENNMGNTLYELGKPTEAIEHLLRAVQINPNYLHAHSNLCVALEAQGRTAEAIEHGQAAVRLDPDFGAGHSNLANALLSAGRTDEAIEHYLSAVQIVPELVTAHQNLGVALHTKGRIAEAIGQFRIVLSLDAGNLSALNGLAWILATCPDGSLRDGPQSVELALEADRLTNHSHPEVLGTLAAAYAEARRFPEAVETARRSVNLAAAAGNMSLANANRTRLQLYESGIPYHEEADLP